jgi:uncharacterized DUF497 family protein
MADEFEWDATKAAANLAKHEVSFEMAREVFNDQLAVDWLEGHEEGEERFNVLGMVSNRLLLVVYTMRNGTIRIISARPATPYEKRLYHEG